MRQLFRSFSSAQRVFTIAGMAELKPFDFALYRWLASPRCGDTSRSKRERYTVGRRSTRPNLALAAGVASGLFLRLCLLVVANSRAHRSAG